MLVCKAWNILLLHGNVWYLYVILGYAVSASYLSGRIYSHGCRNAYETIFYTRVRVRVSRWIKFRPHGCGYGWPLPVGYVSIAILTLISLSPIPSSLSTTAGLHQKGRGSCTATVTWKRELGPRSTRWRASSSSASAPSVVASQHNCVWRLLRLAASFFFIGLAPGAATD